MIISIILLTIGFLLLTKGADYFVEGASAIALKFRIPQIIIGLTIVAMGTSAPEASISITSALKGVTGVAIGNVLGSNIANVLFILGVCAIISPLLLQKKTIKYEIPFVAFITILTCALGYYFNAITRIGAIILLFLFIIFLLYLLKIAKQVEEVDENAKNLTAFKIILFTFGGLFALIYGSDLTINNAIEIAHKLNISDRIIGLTVIAFGTSLPELVTCAVASIKKQNDIAVGNIIGSNIFNLLFVLGLTGVIQPIAFDKTFLFDGLIALIAVVLLFLFSIRKQTLSKAGGLVFLISYLLYIYYIVIK